MTILDNGVMGGGLGGEVTIDGGVFGIANTVTQACGDFSAGDHIAISSRVEGTVVGGLSTSDDALKHGIVSALITLNIDPFEVKPNSVAKRGFSCHRFVRG